MRELARNPDVAKQLMEKLAKQGANGEQLPGNTSPSTDGNNLTFPRGASTSTSDGPGGLSSGGASVQELIREMSQSGLPPLEEIADLMPKVGNGNRAVSGPLAEQLKSMVDRDLSKKLDSNGITRTIRGLVNEAKKAPPPKSMDSPGVSSENSLSSNVEKSVLSTLDGLSKSLLGRNDDKAKEKASSSASSTTPSNNTRTTEGSTARSNKSTVNGLDSNIANATAGNSVASAVEKKEPGFLKSTSKAIDSFFTSGSDGGTSPASSSSDSRSSSTLSGELPGLGGLFWISLFAIVGLVVLLYLLRKRIPGINSKHLGFPLPASAPDNVRTHADVIQAFHALAFRSPGQAESWWTHRRAAAELSPPDSTLQSAWDRLAKLYEEARYQHDRQELSPEKAQAAQQALQTLAQAPSHG
ncbi:MAG: hypothetical protein Aurels2KO_20150 [Aureliella sp.]